MILLANGVVVLHIFTIWIKQRLNAVENIDVISQFVYVIVVICDVIHHT